MFPLFFDPSSFLLPSHPLLFSLASSSPSPYHSSPVVLPSPTSRSVYRLVHFSAGGGPSFPFAPSLLCRRTTRVHSCLSHRRCSAAARHFLCPRRARDYSSPLPFSSQPCPFRIVPIILLIVSLLYAPVHLRRPRVCLGPWQLLLPSSCSRSLCFRRYCFIYHLFVPRSASHDSFAPSRE